MWLLRVLDKSRAAAGKRLGDYYYPCPIDCGMLERWGVTRNEFEAAIAEHTDDASIVKWAQSTISRKAMDAANSWLVVEMFENLDRQDREEGAFNPAAA